MTTKVSMEMLAPDVVAAILGAKEILNIERREDGATYSSSGTSFANASTSGSYNATSETSYLLVLSSCFFDVQRAAATAQAQLRLHVWDGSAHQPVSQPRQLFTNTASASSVRIRSTQSAIALLDPGQKIGTGLGNWNSIRWRAAALSTSPNDTWNMFGAEFLLIEFEP